ncbi:MAG: glutamate 5-kinase [Verrucomicrobiae bacterium]|nr:glutamate 5-kinase [Verrucomicrobiae bacterium]
MKDPRKSLRAAQRLVVKIGTGVLSRLDGGLNPRRIHHLAGQVATLRRQGRSVVLVTSGAIGAGMTRLGFKRRPAAIAELQACAAVGQNLLMARYDHAFAHESLTVAQILLTHEDFRHPERRRNAEQTLRRLLRHGVTPVINENDAVSYAEIKFGDNDQLAAMVTELVGAEACVILSNVDGFHLGRPPKGRLVATIQRITPALERHAGDAGSSRSVGGMKSKLLAARKVNAAGASLVIANGHLSGVLLRLIGGEPLGTIFLPLHAKVKRSAVGARRQTISGRAPRNQQS